MKRFNLIVILLLFTWFCQPMKAVEWEARTGISYAGIWGLHTEALVGFPISDFFQIRPGILLHTVHKKDIGYDTKFRIGVNVPVYASFRIPLGEICKLRLEVGPYVGAEKSNLHLGASTGLAFERSHWSWGVSYFGNCVNNKTQQLHLSVGYNFSCK